jgi:UDP-N-acetylmuramate-alanine ligase
LFEETQKFGHKNTYFEPDLSKIPALVAQMAAPEDLIFILGAGSINRIIPKLIKKLRGK